MLNFCFDDMSNILYFVNSTHCNAYRKQLFNVIHCCRGTVCSKFSHAVLSYPKCWGNFGQQYFSFWFILNFIPYNLNMENIIIHTKTRDVLPSISSTILQEIQWTCKLQKCPKFTHLTVFSFSSISYFVWYATHSIIFVSHWCQNIRRFADDIFNSLRSFTNDCCNLEMITEVCSNSPVENIRDVDKPLLTVYQVAKELSPLKITTDIYHKHVFSILKPFVMEIYINWFYFVVFLL